VFDKRWVGRAAGVALFTFAVAPASADVCARSATVAASPPGYFEFAAVSQAKAAWARKVTRDPKLGRPYASWARARAAKVTCREVGGRSRCIAVGDPCRGGTKT
jgi:hypothetical protein